MITSYVSGNAKIYLTRESVKVPLPGEVPFGAWTIEGNFPDQPTFTSVTLNAVKGTDLQVLCSEAIRGCRVRPY